MSATTSQTLLKLATLITGLVMLGEAKVLFTGLRLAKLAKNPWFTVKNRIMLCSDILFGFILLAFVFRTGSDTLSVLFLIVVCFSFLPMAIGNGSILPKEKTGSAPTSLNLLSTISNSSAFFLYYLLV